MNQKCTTIKKLKKLTRYEFANIVIHSFIQLCDIIHELSQVMWKK